MDRRKALKLGILLGGSLAIPAWMSNTVSKVKATKPQPGCGHLKIRCGHMELYLFTDGHLSLANGQPTFAPQIAPATFTSELQKLHLGSQAMDLSINVMVVKTNDQLILVDSGMGNHSGGDSGWLLQNLQAAGISAHSVTDVLITHAHRDHIGGLVTKDDAIVYRNAKYHISKTEYEFWMSEQPDFSRSKLTDEQVRGTVSFIKKILNRIKGKVQLFTSGDILFSCIHTEPAPGHTPGHITFTISSDGTSITNLVDVFHSPLLITHPQWGVKFDIDFQQGINTRIKVLEDCYTNKRLVMAPHLPWPGLGYIDKKENYFWSPLSYSTPTTIEL